jgi:hypothetical protein
MALQQWQLDAFQQPAKQMCYSLNESPGDIVTSPSGDREPLWVLYAYRMAEHRVMLDCMRQFGLLP